jgi:hypothetical protein
MEPVKPVEAPVTPPPRVEAQRPARPDHRQDFRAQRQEPVKKPEPIHYAQAFKKSSAPKVEVTPVDASQLPAFLLRPVKLPKAPEKKVVEKKPAAQAADEEKPAEVKAIEKNTAEKKTTAKKPRAPRKKAVKAEAPAVPAVTAEPDAV